MKKCLKITILTDYPVESIYDLIKKAARELGLEGTAQKIAPEKIVVLVCGDKDTVDVLLDRIHQGFDGTLPKDVQVEPFLKEKDYRGIFRILE